MKKHSGRAAGLVLCMGYFSSVFAGRLEVPGRFYTGDEARGPDVLALWQFQPGAETGDASGRGHDLSLRGGATFDPDGKFGASLRITPVEPRTWHGGRVASHPDLSPQGAFTIELWISPDPELADMETAYLVDKMSFSGNHRDVDVECQHDYMLRLERVGEGIHQVGVFLGFGREGSVSRYISEPVSFVPNTWAHVAFTYDGEGTGRIYVDGVLRGEEAYPTRRSIVPGSRLLLIGTRSATRTDDSFPGRIDQVRLLDRAATFISGTPELREASLRRNFLRGEDSAHVRLEVRNATPDSLQDAVLDIRFNGEPAGSLDLPVLAPGERHEIAIPIDTRLRTGAYRLEARLNAGPMETVRDIPVRIVSRDVSGRMPVVAWHHHSDYLGLFGDVTRQLVKAGFTHRLGRAGGGIPEGMVWQAGKPAPHASAEYRRRVDEALAQGINITMTPVWASPPSRKVIQEFEEGRFNRVQRNGEPYGHFNACGLFPKLQAFSYHMGASIAQAYHAYPAWDSVLPQSEQRDGTRPCFHDQCRAAFRDHAGHDIPMEVEARQGVNYRTLPDFPVDRIVPDDHPVLTYYRWYWGDGDGWNYLNNGIHAGVRSTGRPDIWTWFDPATRVPARGGNAGDLDVISQWSYTYPNPEVVGLDTDELFAMAAGSGQDVMKMTQIIWYRTQTAPELIDEKAEWEQGPHADPSRARWITIAPDHLQIAFWSKLSRPIQGIMYHGIKSLLPLDAESRSSYRLTQPESADVLMNLVRRVVEPLGPTLRQVPDPAPNVAFLQSFTSQIFTRGGTHGWGGAHWPRSGTSWAADSYLALRYAQLQPAIVYEEAILDGALDEGIEVLFMTDCQVLTEPVAEKVREFQRRGGIVIGDEDLAPGLVPGLTLRRYERPRCGEQSRRALLQTADWIRENLDPYLVRFTDSDNPDVLTRLRRYGSTDYVFAYNDRRKFGSYLGHHGRVMEEGVPSETTVNVRRDGGYVYDLIDTTEVAARRTDGWIGIPREFGAGEGRVWMVTEHPIGGVRVRAPRRVRRGDAFDITATVVDNRRRALDAVVPVRVEIIDARGEPMEYSGYYGATDGRVRIQYETALNDEPGTWHVRVTELASGTAAEARVRVD